MGEKLQSCLINKQAMLVPGPQYTIPSKMVETPGKTMAAKFHNLQGTVTPGVGSYEP